MAVRSSLALLIVCTGAGAALVNPGFESAAPDGTPAGWTVLTGLDPHGYGPPEYAERFDALRPVVGEGGFRSARCLAFPAQGVWRCPVFTHSDGDGSGIDGKRLGKAAAYQTVTLPAGRYRFGVWLRTADGAFYGAAFALGTSAGPDAAYAHDGSTGIRWTDLGLALKSSEQRDPRVRGEWARYATEPFTLDREGPATVWIRFQYANENQFDVRWQADEAAIEPVTDAPPPVAAECPALLPPENRTYRCRVVCGDEETYLADAGGSTVVEADAVRLFRRARALAPGQAVRLAFPVPAEDLPLSLYVSAAGPAAVRVAGKQHAAGGPDPSLPVAREWDVPRPRAGQATIEVVVEARGDARLYEVELGSPGRTRHRLHYVETDVTDVPWVVGTWDAAAREFAGERRAVRPSARLRVEELAPAGRWEVTFAHRPRAGHRYYLVHGLLHGTGRYDVGGDGLVDWIAETGGEELVDLDVTELLAAGDNTVVIDGGGHDFLALVETCPGAVDPRQYQLAFAGDARAERLSQVAHSTWFWLRELHYEPSGFVDASVPHGHWFNQYWPIDIAFALREWVRWGRHEESVRIARLVAGRGWHGHPSNRSGGWDNTGGNILARELLEVLRRTRDEEELRTQVWDRTQTYAEEVAAAAEASPFGLVRGTNWENAGNLQRGPCYALSTTLGAAAGLVKAAGLAERLGQSELAAAWRARADALCEAVQKHLLLREDHTCPSGYVLRKGTLAYGRRTDGAIEDQPLAGWFWGSLSFADVDGLADSRPALRAAYDRTLAEAVPLVARNEDNVVAGYSTAHDGPDTLLSAAALHDRVDSYDILLEGLLRSTDDEEDLGSRKAELSRWAVGSGGGTEDTNLVGTAGFLMALRSLAGLDDLLAGGRQLTLAPRLPWAWTGLFLNGWAVRCRDVEGRERWAVLSAQLVRDAESATLRLRTSSPVPGMALRLGPFPKERRAFRVTVDGEPAAFEAVVSGDAAWVWLRCDAGPRERTVVCAARE